MPVAVAFQLQLIFYQRAGIQLYRRLVTDTEALTTLLGENGDEGS